MTTELSTNKRKHTSGNPFMRYAIHQFHQHVRQLLETVQASTLLEVGCGEGFSSQEILTNSPIIQKSYGGDISFAATIEAQKRFSQMVYHVLDATALPFLSDSVDVVMSLEVLEHLPEPEKAVQEYMRVSRKYLLLSVPNEPIFRGLRFVSGKGIMQLGDHPEHIQHWSIWGFKRFVTEQKLNILASASPFPFSWSIVLCEIQ